MCVCIYTYICTLKINNFLAIKTNLKSDIAVSLVIVTRV